MRRLTNRYLDPEKLKVDNKLRIFEVNSQEEDIAKALGIDEQRENFLREMCHKHFVATGTITNCIQNISKEVGHANELYFCSMLITILHNRRTPSGDILDTMIRDILKRRPKSGEDE